MWWNYQNIDQARADRSGRKWHFRVWHDWVDGTYIQRVFFWDEDREETGLVEFQGSSTLHVRKIKDVIARLVTKADFRRRHAVRLEFPVEKRYATYRKID